MRTQVSRRRLIQTYLGVAILLANGLASGGERGIDESTARSVSFRDVTQEMGISYERAPSSTIVNRQRINSLPTIAFTDIGQFPLKGDGAPGVSVFDFDLDGDLDFFVSNGPGAAHSLFANQLEESGRTAFIDVAYAAGVAAPEQDGTGSCFGDIDNDGDQDLLVLGRAEQHRLFLNRGDGTFADIGAQSGLGSGVGAASCAMGDIDNDGLLDLAIAETYDWSTFLGIVAIPFDLNVHNQLYHNRGNGRFLDVSVDRGFNDLQSGGMPPDVATITWSISMVDYDEDGDIDILHGDDQAAVPGVRRGGVDRGYTMLFENDGTGHFTNKTIENGLNIAAHWMGFSWADYDCNGGMDFFNTNVGDYIFQVIFEALPIPYMLGEWPSGWFFSRPGGGFGFPSVGPDLVATPWGWGSTVLDYDNDGDADTAYHGGLHMGFINALDNPGTVLRNKGLCSGEFEWHKGALSRSHTRRGVEGMAVGDLNRDGFPDLVSAAGFVVPEDQNLDLFPAWGSPFDAVAHQNRLLTPINDLPFGPGWEAEFSGKEVAGGDVVVELNSADNGNHWVSVTLKGSVGLTSEGVVNRDGVGAIITVTPQRGVSQKRPLEAGGTYASQSSFEQLFGMGRARSARIEVRWPGGVRNRLYAVGRGHRVTFPEIPCSFDTDESFRDYLKCVSRNVADLRERKVVNRTESWRFFVSALRAFLEYRHG